MSPQLIWLCDYYTHRTRHADPPQPKTEFGNTWIAARLPIVILAWFRFREWRGLPNPDIDHPLMKAHYAKAYPPRPFFSESILERVIARLRRDELSTLGDLEDATILEPKRWLILATRPEIEPYQSVPLTRYWAPGFKLWFDLPPGFVDRSLPEMLKFVEPDTGTEFRFSAYRNPGISVPDWAQIALSHFARSAPTAARVAARHRLPSWNWTGMAEEFRGTSDASPEPRHHFVAAGKSFWSLLVLHVVAKPEVFSAHGDLYRWLTEWKFGMGEPEAITLVPERHQDIPGFDRIAPDPSWMEAEKQFEIGLLHYHGSGKSEAAQVASRDRSLAAAWFERAAAQDHGKAQFNLAVLLKNGDGVPQDLSAALTWAKKSRSRGVERAAGLIREIETLARKAKPFWKIW